MNFQLFSKGKNVFGSAVVASRHASKKCMKKEDEVIMTGSSSACFFKSLHIVLPRMFVLKESLRKFEYGI